MATSTPAPNPNPNPAPNPNLDPAPDPTQSSSRRGRSRRALAGAGVAVAVVVTGGAAWALTGTQDDSSTVAAGGPGSGQGDPGALAITAEGELSAQEMADLLFMREEEKLAGDVYRTLHDTWGSQVFANIEQAEQHHVEQVLAVMDAYGIDDPSADLDPGEFVNPDLQDLYDELVERGETSLEEALRVGALIEEVDIQDLRDRASDNPDLASLYSRLEEASHNHLRAFVTNLERQGVDYEAVVLEADDVAGIVAASPGQNQNQNQNQDHSSEDCDHDGHSHGDDQGQGQGGPGRGQGQRWGQNQDDTSDA